MYGIGTGNSAQVRRRRYMYRDDPASMIYERNTNTAFDTRTESKSVNGVDVIFALDQTVLDVNE